MPASSDDAAKQKAKKEKQKARKKQKKLEQREGKRNAEGSVDTAKDAPSVDAAMDAGNTAIIIPPTASTSKAVNGVKGSGQTATTASSTSPPVPSATIAEPAANEAWYADDEDEDDSRPPPGFRPAETDGHATPEPVVKVTSTGKLWTATPAQSKPSNIAQKSQSHKLNKPAISIAQRPIDLQSNSSLQRDSFRQLPPGFVPPAFAITAQSDIRDLYNEPGSQSIVTNKHGKSSTINMTLRISMRPLPGLRQKPAEGQARKKYRTQMGVGQVSITCDKPSASDLAATVRPTITWRADDDDLRVSLAGQQVHVEETQAYGPTLNGIPLFNGPPAFPPAAVSFTPVFQYAAPAVTRSFSHQAEVPEFVPEFVPAHFQTAEPPIQPVPSPTTLANDFEALRLSALKNTAQSAETGFYVPRNASVPPTSASRSSFGDSSAAAGYPSTPHTQLPPAHPVHIVDANGQLWLADHAKQQLLPVYPQGFTSGNLPPNAIIPSYAHTAPSVKHIRTSQQSYDSPPYSPHETGHDRANSISAAHPIGFQQYAQYEQPAHTPQLLVRPQQVNGTTYFQPQAAHMPLASPYAYPGQQQQPDHYMPYQEFYPQDQAYDTYEYPMAPVYYGGYGPPQRY